jgi:hypothetical protein
MQSIRRSKYTQVTSAGLDSGFTISLVVIFFCRSVPNGWIPLNWWGNVGVFNTAVYLDHSKLINQEANALPLIALGVNESLWPSNWQLRRHEEPITLSKFISVLDMIFSVV